MTTLLRLKNQDRGLFTTKIVQTPKTQSKCARLNDRQVLIGLNLDFKKTEDEKHVNWQQVGTA